MKDSLDIKIDKALAAIKAEKLTAEQLIELDWQEGRSGHGFEATITKEYRTHLLLKFYVKSLKEKSLAIAKKKIFELVVEAACGDINAATRAVESEMGRS